MPKPIQITSTVLLSKPQVKRRIKLPLWRTYSPFYQFSALESLFFSNNYRKMYLAFPFFWHSCSACVRMYPAYVKVFCRRIIPSSQLLQWQQSQNTYLFRNESSQYTYSLLGKTFPRPKVIGAYKLQATSIQSIKLRIRTYNVWPRPLWGLWFLFRFNY